jgi:hypothetical protein
MGILTSTLPPILLGFLLMSTLGALGANPGLVARITNKGLEYGKKPCWWHQTALGTAGSQTGFCLPWGAC